VTRGAGTLAVLALGLAVPAASATADSFTPVRLAVAVVSSAHVGTPLPISVTVKADAGVLDGSEGPLRIEVKLAGECGGDFAATPGTTLLNAQLNPQPTTGKAYAATATGAGRPAATGTQTVCAFLQDSDVGRVYANDESGQVAVGPAVPAAGGTGGRTVSKRCTADKHAYDGAAKALSRAQGRLRHTKQRAARRRLQRTIAADKRTVARDRTRARTACGKGVKL
jgi:hypothetical protein